MLLCNEFYVTMSRNFCYYVMKFTLLCINVYIVTSAKRCPTHFICSPPSVLFCSLYASGFLIIKKTSPTDKARYHAKYKKNQNTALSHTKSLNSQYNIQ